MGVCLHPPLSRMTLPLLCPPLSGMPYPSLRCDGNHDLASTTCPTYLEILYIKTVPAMSQRGYGRLLMAALIKAPLPRSCIVPL